MADLGTTFVGIRSPNPFWLASAPPTDKEYNVARAFEAGWGGVVWKTLGEDGPPIVNVSGPRYGALLGPDRRVIGFNNIELITDRPLRTNLDEIRRVKRAWPDRALVVSLMVPCEERAWKAILGMVEDTGADGVELNFGCPARHERTRHGLGGGPGARVHPDGHRLVQAALAAAGDRQAHAQHHRHPAPRACREGGWGRRGEPDQHRQLDHGRRPRAHDHGTGRRRPRFSRRLLRPGGQADRAQHGGRDRARPRRPSGCRSRASAASPPGAMGPSTSRWAAATCRCAPRRWSTASRSCRT
jgi:hypothetical protein